MNGQPVQLYVFDTRSDGEIGQAIAGICSRPATPGFSTPR